MISKERNVFSILFDPVTDNVDMNFNNLFH